MKWVELFKEDALFFTHNAYGKIDGKVIDYVNGKVFVIGNVVNGIKQGWETMYYDNGTIKSKTYFVDGEPAATGYLIVKTESCSTLVNI